MPEPTPSRPSADRNLLFGILALQMDFIDRDALVRAMGAWVLEKHKPLGQVLPEQAALRDDEHALLEALVQKHLDRHGGSAERSLAAVSSVASVRQELEQIADADVQASLVRVAAARQDDDPYATRASAWTPAPPGQRFRILRPHARGGLGQVSVALDAELHREVALKEIQDRHADHPEFRARFLLEAEITGGLEHPGIVPVYSLGSYADGRPYYAMRFIKGDSLKEAIERFHQADVPGRAPGERTLALRQLLGRFLDVCNAVAYAHSRGVLHRDLKPGNVMLGPYGETLVVDWGLAKPLGRRGADGHDPADGAGEGALMPASASGSTPTQVGQAIGTPAFMSPEQAAGRLGELGPASDVYSLGAMLYCLLTGRVPYDGADAGAILRKVQQGEAPPPRQVNPRVPRPLEAVCLKAMALRPADRYTTPRALAGDLEHWLAGEPVSAWPEPWTVRTRRWLGRHRTLVTAAVAALLVAVASLAAATLLLQAANIRERQATLAKEEARAAEAEQRHAAEKAAAAEKEANEQTQRRLAQIEKGVELFAGMLSGINPRSEEKEGKPLYEQLRERAEKAADQLQAEAVADPQAEARLQTVMGNTLLELGSYVKAVEVLERARATRERELGADHSDTLTTLNNLAVAYRAAGRTADAIALYEQVRDAWVKKLGADHPDTLATLNNLADAYQAAGRTADAIALYEQVRDAWVKKLGADHPDTLATLGNLADAYRAAGRTADAIALFEQVRDAQVKKLGADHRETLTTLNNLALAYWAAGRTADAIALYEQVRDAQVKKLGADHPNTLTTLNNLAAAYQDAGRTADAIALYEQVRDAEVKKLGADHPSNLGTLDNLAGAYQAAGRTADAIALYEQVRDAKVKKLGADHPGTLTTLHNLAVAYQAAGRTADAIALYEQVRDAEVKKLGADHPSTLATLSNLAGAYQAGGRTADAIALFEQVRDAQVKKLGADHPDTLMTLNNLAAAYWSLKRLDQSIPLFEDVLTRQEKKLGRQHPDTLRTVANLGVNYKDAGRLAEAIPLLEEAYRAAKKHPTLRWVGTPLLDAYAKASRAAEAARLIDELLADIRKQLPRDSPQLAGQLAQFGLALLEAKGFAEAEPLLRECLAIRERTQADAWTTFNTQSQLGGAILGQARSASKDGDANSLARAAGLYRDAEPLLLKGYEGMKARATTIPPQGSTRIPGALDRLIELYTATDRPDEAKKWRDERARYANAGAPREESK